MRTCDGARACGAMPVVVITAMQPQTGEVRAACGTHMAPVTRGLLNLGHGYVKVRLHGN